MCEMQHIGNPFAVTRRAAVRLGSRWRRERYERFARLCHLHAADSIIDVGSGGGHALAKFNRTNPITAVDLNRWPHQQPRNVTFIEADGRCLPFPDRAFDVAFSNSVIEHMSADDQVLFASEIRRVARRYYVQTPNKWFPIEPHYQIPFFQFVPDTVKFWLNRRWKIGWQAKGACETIHLVGTKDMRRLFPDAEIHSEKVLGLTKSLMVVRAEAPEISEAVPAGPRAVGSESRSAGVQGHG